VDAQNEDKKGPISLPETHSESPSKPQTPTIEEPVVDSVPLASPAEQTKAQLESPQPTVETPSKEDASSEAEAMPYTRLETQPNTATTDNEATAPALAKANGSESPESNTDIEAIKTQHQEEIQEYVERIDSLQSKLQYLSKKATESAKKATQAAQSGTTERKLAEKDEKIALLLEEGQKLSSTEHKLRMVIKKLRLQIGEQEKQTESLKKSVEKAEADTEALRNRLTGDEAEEKRQEETRNAMATLQKEIDSLKKERTAKDEAMRRLEQDLKAKAESSAAASVEAHNKMLAAEQEKRKQLEDTVASLKAESDSLANKHRLETVEWAEKLDRAQERARTLESESKLELLSMENKLEAMRSAAEEAASGAGGEGQVNLIRQIETLQSQYATASSNWQGIEASLLAKVSNLEKEKDEAQRRESEMRKKARDAVSVPCWHVRFVEGY
jgi:chromosome segregation ATPase